MHSGQEKVFIIGSFVMAVFIFISFAGARDDYVVEFREDGFYPQELQVSKGSKVVFVNRTNQPFWPASNPHPTHDINPAFDSGQPINAGGSWNFKFTQDGIFKYHDHLFPYFNGTIIVGDLYDADFAVDTESCLNIAEDDMQRTCFKSLFENTLYKRGLEEGKGLFKELVLLQPDDCHQYGHDLGYYAYGLYSQGQKVGIGQEASYCAYGFWHGFMANMIADSNPESAKEFCESMSGSSPELSLELKRNCYHGIGIGLVPDPPPLRLWGETWRLIEPALIFCDSIGDEDMKSNCYSGVFHPVINYMAAREYMFDFDPNEPFSLCFSQEEKYRPQCYFQIAPKIAGVSGYDLSRAFELLKPLFGIREFGHTFMLSMASFVYPQTSLNEHLNFMDKCRGLDPTVSGLCAHSVVKSFFDTGAPEEEYVAGIEFCDSDKLNESDRLSCFESVVSYSRLFYSDEKMTDICGTIEKNYKNICR